MKAHILTAGTIYEGDWLQAPLEPGYTLAILDGPYGIGKAGWDKMGIEGLADWYAPHLARVSSLCYGVAMPRPKKTTPTVATTEPDTNLNPDRAQVAAVADLPHTPRIAVDSTPEGAPATVAHVEQVLPSGAKVPSREWVDQCEAKLAEQDAALQAIARVVGMASAGDLAEMVARVRTIAEQSARIAELEAANTLLTTYAQHCDNVATHRRNALDGIRDSIVDAGYPLGDDTDPKRTPLLQLVRAVLAKVPRTPHDHAAGYLAIVSGNVRAARWKRNILHDIRDPDMVIGQIDHLTDGWAPSVKGAAAPPMKTEAEARAWCETRCGWTVVA